MDDAKRRKELARAELASHIADNPVWTELWDGEILDITTAWVNSSDADEREHLHSDIKGLQRVRSRLERIILTGELAQSQLNEGSK